MQSKAQSVRIRLCDSIFFLAFDYKEKKMFKFFLRFRNKNRSRIVIVNARSTLIYLDL